ncbi:MAG: hypothetical protein JWM85_3062 [Acidimicrobiaceae bacterium]|nr:hypothetical protein [Acidimicrobiaceae bacterium]
MSRDARLRAPRRIRTGELPARGAGTQLACAVLSASNEEWVGVDLASGALLRSPAGSAGAFHAAGEPVPGRLQVVELTLAQIEHPSDPARPEAVEPAGPLEPVGWLRPRRTRKLLRRLAAPERQGAPLLGTWGPSAAYADLDGTTPSAVVVPLGRQALSLGRSRNGAPEAILTWGRVTQGLPLLDPVAAESAMSARHALDGARLAAALGFRPGFALLALLGVEGGHARKVVLALFPA